ncbi:PEP/pyruvate-binding domain-containing protein [Sphingorhabdus arenilitoris]|uniref:PEP/pyruvate-binding domain-containing protein n=1 Tax=Sphingorhabdus arenilitoris TaxID=1490041 RepID=A0ABV8RIH5_9SPHN
MNNSCDISQTGGKAAALMRLVASGFDIPAFFTLPPALFQKNVLPENAHSDLVRKLAEIGPGPYAARSSAVEEDGDAHSHAGQFLSVLNLSAQEVPAAAERVYKSGLQDSVQGYRATRGLTGEGGGTAVLVQQMVDARAAGVAFTADPVSGRRDRIVISAIAGLGDRLVGGEEDGETYIISDSGKLIDGDVTRGVLSQQDICALHKLAIEVQQACGGPQDIEWAFEGDRLYLLQARPITTPLLPPVNADTALTIFDNSNIVESYPGMVSPLTYSFAQYAYARVYRAFLSLLGVGEAKIAHNAAVFDNMLGRIDGRVYYNLVNWYRALALLPGFSINRSHMETMMGVSEPLPAEVVDNIGPPPAKGAALWAEWLRVTRSGFKLAFEAFRLNRTKADFYRRLNAALAIPASEIEAMPLTGLAKEYRRIEADLLDRWDAPLINDFLCMMAFGGSRKMLEKWGGPLGLEVHNDIMIGQGDIISAEPAQRIRRMGAMLSDHPELKAQMASGSGVDIATHPELAAEIASYLAKFADRCTEELKLESVTLDRDPTPLYRAIAAGGGGHKESADQSGALKQLLRGKPVRHMIARVIMRWAKARVRDRENLRFERTRIFGRARLVFRTIGAQFAAQGVIADREDIFLLSVQEILGAIEGFGLDSDLRGLIELRRAHMAQAAKRPDPDERIEIRGAIFADLAALVPAPVIRNNDELIRSGTGCSAGTVTATARIIRDPRTQALAKGDILVARHTDPGWIAVFANASAIVVERGSLLSHSAIVARELGIPCVVGMKDAMNWIKDGETIEVDGGNGRVRRII